MALDLAILGTVAPASAAGIAVADIPRPSVPTGPLVNGRPAPPAVRPLHALQRVDEPDRTDPWQAARAKDRAVAVEMRNAVAAWDELTRTGLNQETAAVQLATRRADFPILSVKGRYQQTAINVRNLREWAATLGKRADGRPNLENVDALLPQYHKCGRHSYALQCPEFLAEFARLYENGNEMKFETAYRWAMTECLAKGLHQEMFPPFGSLVTYYEKYKGKAAVRLARSKNDDERRNLTLHVIRDYAGIVPGRCLVADHRTLDWPIRMPTSDGGWQATRPVMTAFLDLKSRRMVAFALGEVAPNRLTVLQVLYNAVRNMGGVPPGDLIIDNGKDFLALGVAKPVSWDGTAHSVCLDLGIRVRKAIPRNPESKTVENFFSIMSGDLDRLFPSYRGCCPEHRPDYAHAAWQKPETLFNLDQATVIVAAWLDKFYHPRRQDSAATEGRSPDEVWAEFRPARPALTEAQLQLAFTIPLSLPRRVLPGGCLRMGKGEYQSARLYDLVDHDVYVRTATASDDVVIVCRADGAVLCEAKKRTSVPALCDSDEDWAMLAEQMKEKHRWLAHLREAKRTSTGSVRSVPLTDPWKLICPDMDPAQLLAAGEEAASIKPARQITADSAAIAGASPAGRGIPFAESAPSIAVPQDVAAAVRKAVFGAQDVVPALEMPPPAGEAGEAEKPAAAPTSVSADAEADTSLQDALANLGM